MASDVKRSEVATAEGAFEHYLVGDAVDQIFSFLDSPSKIFFAQVSASLHRTYGKRVPKMHKKTLIIYLATHGYLDAIEEIIVGGWTTVKMKWILLGLCAHSDSTPLRDLLLCSPPFITKYQGIYILFKMATILPMDRLVYDRENLALSEYLWGRSTYHHDSHLPSLIQQLAIEAARYGRLDNMKVLESLPKPKDREHFAEVITSDVLTASMEGGNRDLVEHCLEAFGKEKAKSILSYYALRQMKRVENLEFAFEVFAEMFPEIEGNRHRYSENLLANALMIGNEPLALALITKFNLKISDLKSLKECMGGAARGGCPGVVEALQALHETVEFKPFHRGLLHLIQENIHQKEIDHPGLTDRLRRTVSLLMASGQKWEPLVRRFFHMEMALTPRIRIAAEYVPILSKDISKFISFGLSKLRVLAKFDSEYLRPRMYNALSVETVLQAMRGGPEGLYGLCSWNIMKETEEKARETFETMRRDPSGFHICFPKFMRKLRWLTESVAAPLNQSALLMAEKMRLLACDLVKNPNIELCAWLLVYGAPFPPRLMWTLRRNATRPGPLSSKYA